MSHRPFIFDFAPAKIRSVNFAANPPSFPLTNHAIKKYILLGKYGPEMQKRAQEKENLKCDKKRNKAIRKQLKQKMVKVMERLGY